jgi:prepilin signal peptidase PulO-like enzyme (type II secretory pathway)
MLTWELLIVVVAGLCFGSFVTMAAHRLPRGEKTGFARSRCPSCKTVLAVRDLVPLLSWLLSKGRCRHCKANIGIRYPLIEISTAILFVLVYSQQGLALPALPLYLMVVALMVMLAVDVEHYIIPDIIHIALLACALAYHTLSGTLNEQVAYGFGIAALLGLVLHHGYYYIRGRDGLGYGDVKYFAVAGAWLGPLGLVVFLFMIGVFGVLTGLVWRALGKGPEFPFAPALAAALLLCVLWPELANFLINNVNS